MNTHKNARLTYLRRLEMVQDITERGVSPAEAAARHGVSAVTARKWLGRYLAGEIIEAVSGMPWERFIETRILQRVGMTHSTSRHGDAAAPGDVATTAALNAATGRMTLTITWTGKDNGETRTLRTVTDVRP